MNVEIGTEAAQFAEKEYIKGIFMAVYTVYTLSPLAAASLILLSHLHIVK
jgi:hypothetical protein